MRLVIRIDDSHAPFVRQAYRLGRAVRLDVEGFPALLPGEVLGTLEERDTDVYDGTFGASHLELRDVVVPLEGP